MTPFDEQQKIDAEMDLQFYKDHISKHAFIAELTKNGYEYNHTNPHCSTQRPRRSFVFQQSESDKNWIDIYVTFDCHRYCEPSLMFVSIDYHVKSNMLPDRSVFFNYERNNLNMSIIKQSVDFLKNLTQNKEVE